MLNFLMAERALLLRYFHASISIILKTEAYRTPPVSHDPCQSGSSWVNLLKSNTESTNAILVDTRIYSNLIQKASQLKKIWCLPADIFL